MGNTMKLTRHATAAIMLVLLTGSAGCTAAWVKEDLARLTEENRALRAEMGARQKQISQWQTAFTQDLQIHRQQIGMLRQWLQNVSKNVANTQQQADVLWDAMGSENAVITDDFAVIAPRDADPYSI